MRPIDKGNSVERQIRKATGLRTSVYDSGVTKWIAVFQEQDQHFCFGSPLEENNVLFGEMRKWHQS